MLRKVVSRIRSLFSRWMARDDRLPMMLILRSGPANLHAAQIQSLLSAALGISLTVGEADNRTIIEDSGRFICLYDGDVLMIQEHGPLPPSLACLAKSVKEVRSRDAVEKHKAVLQVAIVKMRNRGTSEEALGLLGKAAASLSIDGTLGMLLHESDRTHIAAFTDEQRELLKGGNPRSAFSIASFAGIMEADSEEEDLVAAIQQARNRFNEFSDAFLTASDRSSFHIKYPFEDGDDVEHMWVQVKSMGQSTIEGIIVNEPFSNKKYKFGQSVVLEKTRITDWIYADGESMVGGFTNSVIAGKTTD